MIHIVGYVNTDVRHMDHWQTVVPQSLRDAGYDVNVIGDGQSTIVNGDWNLLGEIYHKTSQFQDIYQEIVTRNISSGDIFLIGDAWNPSMISFKYMQLIMNLDVTVIGFWRDGIYDINSKIRTGLLRKPKRWAKTFERAMYDSYDYNCFISDKHKSRFIRRYNLHDGEKSVVTGLPYEMLRDVRQQYTPVKKENIIVIPHDSVDKDHRDIFKALKNYLSEYTFIDCHELELTSSEYYSILNRAKAVIAINLSETDPTNIYEAMLFGCVPIIPDRAIYDEMFPSEYAYPSHYTQPPFLNFVRGKDFMHDRVDTVFKNYETMSANLDRDARDIGNRFFNNERLLSLIQTITDRYEFRKPRRGKTPIRY